MILPCAWCTGTEIAQSLDDLAFYAHLRGAVANKLLHHIDVMDDVEDERLQFEI